jgi:hypothetical protein
LRWFEFSESKGLWVDRGGVKQRLVHEAGHASSLLEHRDLPAQTALDGVSQAFIDGP